MDFELNFVNDWAMLLVPCCFIFLDYITGIIKACYKGEFKSSIMRKGLTKKCGEVIIIVCFELLTAFVGLPKYIETFMCLYIILMEFMSIIENLKSMGVKIPSFIDKALTDQSEKMDKGDDINE